MIKPSKFNYIVISKEGYPDTVIKCKKDGYYWRQPTHYSADWIKYNLPDSVIEPQLEKLRNINIDPIELLNKKT